MHARVLDRLVAARLVVADDRTAEVAHEALIREWPQLREWLDADRDALRLHRLITDAATDWDRAGRDPSLLFRGGRLAVATEWLAGHAADANDLERAFVEASRDAVGAGGRRAGGRPPAGARGRPPSRGCRAGPRGRPGPLRAPAQARCGRARGPAGRGPGPGGLLLRPGPARRRGHGRGGQPGRPRDPARTGGRRGPPPRGGARAIDRRRQSADDGP